MTSAVKLLLTAAVYFTTSGGLLIGVALPKVSAVETNTASYDVVPNDSMTECGLTMEHSANEHYMLLPSCHHHTTDDKEWNNKSTTLVTAPSTQFNNLSRNPFSSVTTPASVPLKTHNGGHRATIGSAAHKRQAKSFQEIEHEYQLQRNEKMWHNTILVEYREAFTRIVERLTLFKNTTKRYFTMVQGSGQRALAAAKLKATEFYKISSSVMHRVSDVIAAQKTAMMGFYNFASGFQLMNRSIMAGYYEDAFTGMREHLTLFKNKTKRCFTIVQRSLAVTKLGAIECYKTSSSAISHHTGVIVSAYKPTMMAYYNKAKSSASRRASSAMGQTGRIFSTSKLALVGFCNHVKGSGRDGSILSGYADVPFTGSSEQLLTPFKNAAMRCFRMLQDVGEKALVVVKHEGTEFLKSLIDLSSQVVVASNSVVIEYYNWVTYFARNSSISAAYRDVPLVATKKAAVPWYGMVQDFVENAVVLAKGEAMQFFKFHRQVVAAYKSAMMGYYNQAKVFAEKSSILAQCRAVFTETSEQLIAIKKAAMSGYRVVVEKAIAVTRREFPEFFKSWNVLRPDGMSAFKPGVMNGQLQPTNKVMVPCFTPTLINYATCGLPKKLGALAHR